MTIVPGGFGTRTPTATHARSTGYTISSISVQTAGPRLWRHWSLSWRLTCVHCHSFVSRLVPLTRVCLCSAYLHTTPPEFDYANGLASFAVLNAWSAWACVENWPGNFPVWGWVKRSLVKLYKIIFTAFITDARFCRKYEQVNHFRWASARTWNAQICLYVLRLYHFLLGCFSQQCQLIHTAAAALFTESAIEPTVSTVIYFSVCPYIHPHWDYHFLQRFFSKHCQLIHTAATAFFTECPIEPELPSSTCMSIPYIHTETFLYHVLLRCFSKQCQLIHTAATASFTESLTEPEVPKSTCVHWDCTIFSIAAFSAPLASCFCFAFTAVGQASGIWASRDWCS